MCFLSSSHHKLDLIKPSAAHSILLSVTTFVCLLSVYLWHLRRFCWVLRFLDTKSREKGGTANISLGLLVWGSGAGQDTPEYKPDFSVCVLRVEVGKRYLLVLLCTQVHWNGGLSTSLEIPKVTGLKWTHNVLQKGQDYVCFTNWDIHGSLAKWLAHSGPCINQSFGRK